MGAAEPSELSDGAARAVRRLETLAANLNWQGLLPELSQVVVIYAAADRRGSWWFGGRGQT